MASMTIRNLDDDIKASLRVRAAQHGHSMEAEVRAILRSALDSDLPAANLAEALNARFASVRGEFPAVSRGPRRKTIKLDDQI